MCSEAPGGNVVAGLINVHFATGGADLVKNTGLFLINLRWVTILLTGKVTALYSKYKPPTLLIIIIIIIIIIITTQKQQMSATPNYDLVMCFNVAQNQTCLCWSLNQAQTSTLL
jgi:hypothetical protein